MKRILVPLLLISASSFAQNVMTPELLWSLKRVGIQGLSNSGKTVYYSTRQYDWKTEKSTTVNYKLNIAKGEREELVLPDKKSIVQRDANGWYASDGKTLFRSKDNGKTWGSIYEGAEGMDNIRVSPDGSMVAYSKEVAVTKMMGTDIHPDLKGTTMQVYTDLNYRHWDTWEDGSYAHVFITPISGGMHKDLLQGMPYDCPQKPFGGTEDFIWTPDSKGIVYVCKKKVGKEYATSTQYRHLPLRYQ